MLARSKLNGIESKICEALLNNETSHEDFVTIINEEKKYRELKESTRMMNSQRCDTEKITWLKKAKKWALMKLLSVMKLLITVENHKYKMKSYCLQCKKDTENINSRVSNTSNGKTMLLSKCA